MNASSELLADLPDAALIPDTVVQGRYRIVRKLGRGGMGAVYEAVDQRLGLTVALKETLSSEVALRKQFEREARLLANLQHPALPRVTDHFVEGNRAFLVMQYIAGVDLARIIAQQPGPFPRDQVIAWADQLLDALVYLHSHDRQVIHRDIKPHNLKLTSTDQIALLDFGLAKAQPTDTSVTASRGFFGYTRQYAPLEQIEDRRTDSRSDIYALGATLYHLLTGIKPPDALARASAVINSEADPLEPANQIHPAVGAELAAILSKAMAQRPEERYATAAEFREALRRVGRTGAVPQRLHLAPEADAVSEITAVRQEHPTVVRMAMVESKSRFGPGAAAASLVILCAIGYAAFYSSREATIENAKDDAAKAASVESKPNAATRKSERATLANESVVSNKKEASERSRLVSQTNEASKPSSRNNENKKNDAVSAPAVPRQRASSTTRQKTIQSRPRSAVDAPVLRLPNPELQNNVTTPANESRIRANTSSGQPPQFFRAADGTLTVRFADGTTRTVRPGETSARPN